MNDHQHYRRLLLMALLSFVSMYVLMYSMVDRWDNVFSNVNQLYMAGLMAAPMVIIEIAVMSGMYKSRTRNLLFLTASAVAGIVFFSLIRQQTGVGDGQFLRSMIPHHAGAILMCQEASLGDAAIKELCRNIIASQESEIEQMKALLRR